MKYSTAIALVFSAATTLLGATSWGQNFFPSTLTPISSQKVLLGSTYLMNRNDQDFIQISPNVGCGMTALQIGVQGDSATIYDLKVVFGNGQFQDISVRSQFANGSYSAWKDLNGTTRCISGIYIYGKSNQRTPQQTKVNFYGLKQVVAPAPHAKLLGSTYLMNTRDADLITLPQAVCGLTKFKIVIKNDAARIETLKVQFGNGQVEDFHVRRYFPINSSSAWMDLIGNTRCIKKIYIVGKSSSMRPQQTKVEFWGLQQ